MPAMEFDRVRSATLQSAASRIPSITWVKASASSSSPGRKRRRGFVTAAFLGLDAAIVQEVAHPRDLVLGHQRGRVAAVLDDLEASIRPDVDHGAGHILR